MLPMHRIAGALAVAVVAALTAAAPAPAQVPCPRPLCEPEPTPTPTPTPSPRPRPTPTPTPDPGQPPPGPPAPAPTALSGTATFQADPGHTGWVPQASLIAPLRPRWTRPFAAGMPLAGEGRVYVVAEGALRALDPRTGADLWAVPTSGQLGAYDAGRLFVTAAGFLTAYAAADGRQLWTREIDSSYSLSTVPVATGGSVYISTDSGTSSIVALDAETGRVRWNAEGNGTGNTPAVDGERVYASYACGWTYAWDRAGGKKRWNTDADCSGGGGSTPVVSGGRLYVPENSGVYEAATGRLIGTYPGGTPVFADGVGIYTGTTTSEDSTAQTRTMQAVDPASGRLIWSAAVPAGTTEGSTVTPLAVGSAVYTMAGGVLSARKLRTGQLLWSFKPPAAETTYSSDSAGVRLGAAPDLLLVARGKSLTAYENAFTPPPGGIDVGATDFDPFIGQTLEVGGLLGRDLRARVPQVVIEGDRAPFGKRFRRLARARPNEDGFFTASLKPDRNLRVRVRAGSVRSQTMRIAVIPRYRFAFRALGTTGRRVRVRFTIRGPRDVRLTGRRAYVYLGRMARRRYQRLGASRVRTVRRGRSAGAITIPLVTSGEKDIITLCIPGQVRLGLGPADVLTRRCGARSVRYGRGG